jgi:hypothetical protein
VSGSLRTMHVTQTAPDLQFRAPARRIGTRAPCSGDSGLRHAQRLAYPCADLRKCRLDDLDLSRSLWRFASSRRNTWGVCAAQPAAPPPPLETPRPNAADHTRVAPNESWRARSGRGRADRSRGRSTRLRRRRASHCGRPSGRQQQRQRPRRAPEPSLAAQGPGGPGPARRPSSVACPGRAGAVS